MSVIVNKLTKVYGTQKAVNEVSFKANKGEVLGFLGPNGAGKTTTMKMITCFIPQTTGEASVCGFDTMEDSIEVRKRIGYLPEHNPLYKDMYVREYLSFIAGLHDIDNTKKRIADLIELTGLEREQRKIIGALSKGYRQRVGLAQAMLHDPEVLILDEPTSGLDPNQLVGIRQLIKQLGEEKTVIFSTHIMQEVQAICDRVLIINKGRLVADDKIEHLQHYMGGEVVLSVEFKEKVDRKSLQALSKLKRVEPAGSNRWQLITNEQDDIRAEVFQFAVSNSLTILEMKKEVSSVEDVFQLLTASNDNK